MRVSADETHHLHTATSLVEDGDPDVSDEYLAGRCRPFRARRPPQDRRQESGRLVEPHDPLLPALLRWPGWRPRVGREGLAGNSAWVRSRTGRFAAETAGAVAAALEAAPPGRPPQRGSRHMACSVGPPGMAIGPRYSKPCRS